MTNTQTAARNPQVQAQYDKERTASTSNLAYPGLTPCALCAHSERKLVEATATMLVIENDYPYECFANRRIKTHLMITPKRHIQSMDDFSSQERDEYWWLSAKYRRDGCAIYTRSEGDTMSSIPQHLHTHLFSYVSAEE